MTPRTAANSEFRKPTESPLFEPERIAALAPPNAAIKGLFLEDTLSQATDRAEALRRAGVTATRFPAFSDVPYLSYLRVMESVAKMKHPTVPVGSAVRHLARSYYARFRETMAGKVVFGVLGGDAARVLSQGYRGWSMTLNFGTFGAEVLGPRHMRYRFADYPSMMVETGDVGVVLGAMDTLGVRGQVLVATLDKTHAELDISW